MSDNPTHDATLFNLDLADNPKPYVYVTKRGDKVTFPDPGEMDMVEAEDFLRSMQTKPDSEVIKEWVGDEGYQLIRQDRWTLRQKNAVLDAVYRHYAATFGTPGE